MIAACLDAFWMTFVKTLEAFTARIFVTFCSSLKLISVDFGGGSECGVTASWSLFYFLNTLYAQCGVNSTSHPPQGTFCDIRLIRFKSQFRHVQDKHIELLNNTNENFLDSRSITRNRATSRKITQENEIFQIFPEGRNSTFASLGY